MKNLTSLLTILSTIFLVENISAQTNNTATGVNALYHNTTGVANSAFGYGALYNNTTGSGNSGLGLTPLYNNTSGNYNTAVGYQSLYGLATGSYNVAVGYYAVVSPSNVTNATAIGANAVCGASNKVVIGSSSVTSIGGYVGWTNFSDGRYKQDVQQDVPGLAFINKLQPVTYRLNIGAIEEKLHAGNADGRKSSADPLISKAQQEKAAITYTGFIAQDVEKAAAALNYDFSGVDKPKDENSSFYGLRYGDFVVPLVKAVQELSKMNDEKNNEIDSLKKENETLEARVSKLEQMMNASYSKPEVMSLSSASLEQNAPNPFGSSTRIGYQLPEAYSSARIVITDEKGVVMKQINLDTKGKGNISIDASALLPGTYLYTLYVDGKRVDTKKMLSAK